LHLQLLSLSHKQHVHVSASSAYAGHALAVHCCSDSFAVQGAAAVVQAEKQQQVDTCVCMATKGYSAAKPADRNVTVGAEISCPARSTCSSKRLSLLLSARRSFVETAAAAADSWLANMYCRVLPYQQGSEAAGDA
jgi:hypothetical protein